jgi:hypothetical protein
MIFERGNFGYFIAFILIGGILGSALGTLAAHAVPALSFIKTSLTGAVGFNLEIIQFGLNLNLSSIVGIVLGIVLFKKI